ncbi:hypothetical protein LEP1GSC202_2534 [Leptospira yanagawae serovar Saopaulo str. Sao Paulo = ATCC 700523]|uniref:Uncharacterized protein n=1 Tax=Leptospira yanagawae serovar Saopaulo str. Sao Paulo = ATCC 700523 TaxID=1249483 RepID=A0A5E8H8Y8_9LEPT|nr:hypothetical protein LEP1GSC202_2534 [Leptospira yanagawae serovar Saopaulo str. Sao Paulo = ATCC 700523]
MRDQSFTISVFLPIFGFVITFKTTSNEFFINSTFYANSKGI